MNPCQACWDALAEARAENKTIRADEREKIAANAPTDLEWTEGEVPSEDGLYLIGFSTIGGGRMFCAVALFQDGHWHTPATVIRHARINTKGEGGE
jgi:hypothetical protein